MMYVQRGSKKAGGDPVTVRGPVLNCYLALIQYSYSQVTKVSGQLATFLHQLISGRKCSSFYRVLGVLIGVQSRHCSQSPI
jgi:hypothetical protein